jgi:hypothetical protein
MRFWNIILKWILNKLVLDLIVFNKTEQSRIFVKANEFILNNKIK